MTIPEILEALTYPMDYLPEDALRAAVEQREALIPELLRTLEAVAETPEVFANREKYELHFFALHLLAQFREKRAFPLVLRILSAPGDVAERLFGSILTDSLHRLLGSLYDGDSSRLRRLIEDPHVDECIRGDGIDTLLVLFVSGQMTRDEVVNHLHELLAGGLEREPSSAWDTLVGAVGLLPAPELRDEVRRALAEGLVDPDIITESEIEEDLALSDRARQLRMASAYRLAGDAIEELSEAGSNDGDDLDGDALGENLPDHGAIDEAVYDILPPGMGDLAGQGVPEGTVVRDSPKVGRNNPCPCGSGKKYKKCCLGKPDAGI